MAEITNLLPDENNQPEAIQDLQAVGKRASKDAMRVRDLFKDFSVNYSPLDWQHGHINCGRFT